MLCSSFTVITSYPAINNSINNNKITDTLGKSVTDYLMALPNSKPIDRMHGKPSLFSYYLLVNQLAVKATAVETKQWGGKHGHLPLIINNAKLRTISGVAAATTDKMATPTGMYPDIDGKHQTSSAKISQAFRK